MISKLSTKCKNAGSAIQHSEDDQTDSCWGWIDPNADNIDAKSVSISDQYNEIDSAVSVSLLYAKL